MAMTLITTNTSSSVTTSSFTSGIDSTYKLYIFKIIDLGPETDNKIFTFDGSTDGGDNYGVTKTTTLFDANHTEADAIELTYETGDDLAQATGGARIQRAVGNGADESAAGELHLFNPSSTTYVKHFYVNTHYYHSADTAYSAYVGGYINDTTAIDDIRFKMSAGAFDGRIKMWRVK